MVQKEIEELPVKSKEDPETNINEKIQKNNIEESIEIQVDVLAEEENVADVTVNVKQEKYCPSWMFPARFGPVKVSSCVRLLVIVTLATVIGILFILSIIPDSPITSSIERLLTWIESIPIYYQILAVLLFYSVSGPLGAPVTPINIACGFLFQFVIGILVALTGTLMGASICFGLGKTLLFKWANEQMEKHRTLRALGIAVQTQAIKLIILTHLSPILPATLLHYTYSSVGVMYSKFCIGTFIGVLPFVVVYVYIGSVSHSLTSAIAEDNEDTSITQEILWMVGIVAISILLLVVVTWIGKRELNRALEELNRLDEESAEKEIEMEEITSDSIIDSDEEEEEFIDSNIPVNSPVKEIILDEKKYPRYPRAPSYDIDLKKIALTSDNSTIEKGTSDAQTLSENVVPSSTLSKEIHFPDSQSQDNEISADHEETATIKVEMDTEKSAEICNISQSEEELKEESDLLPQEITSAEKNSIIEEIVEEKNEISESEESSISSENISLKDIGDDHVSQTATPIDPIDTETEITEVETQDTCVSDEDSFEEVIL